tara:strand:- start:120 stop:392 length:273 start_codon:yes stop_codon:yes gene_type:complete
MELKDRMKYIPKEEISFMIKWFCSLLIMWYISTGLYLYRPNVLKMIYWPLHTHDIEITVITSTVNWEKIHHNIDIMETLDIYRIKLEDLK